jgi:hypothetical protein
MGDVNAHEWKNLIFKRYRDALRGAKGSQKVLIPTALDISPTNPRDGW